MHMYVLQDKGANSPGVLGKQNTQAKDVYKRHISPQSPAFIKQNSDKH